MNILLTNDDGIQADGILQLEAACRSIGQLAVVAPDRERSAVSHALTLHSPLRAVEVDANRFAVDGTPTDCVNLALHGLLEWKPDVLISGINRGGNMGDDITYSGTVAAAMEGTIMGIPSIAVSLDFLATEQEQYRYAAEYVAGLAQRVVAKGLPADTYLNVNVPYLDGVEPKEALWTRQGRRLYGDMIEKKIDPRGRAYYWLGGGELDYVDEPGTDFHAVARGHISITPLHFDLTNHASLEQLRGGL